MLSFNLKSKKIPSKSHFKKYKGNTILKNINLMEDPTSISHDKLCQLVEIQNKYDCSRFGAFRGLGESPPNDGEVQINENIAIGLIELESLRILNLTEALNYDLDDHTVVLNYLRTDSGFEADRSAAVNYIIERASQYLSTTNGTIIGSTNMYRQTSKFRNPLKGYRKGQPICNNSLNNKCSVQEIYKDTHSIGLGKAGCYDNRIRSIINKGDDIVLDAGQDQRDVMYNSNYNQYIKKKIGNCKIVTNRNPKFYQNNSVSSSSRLAKLKYDTLSRTSKSCSGDYKAVPQKDVLGIVKPNIKVCNNPTSATEGKCYIMINGRKRKKR